MSAPILLSSDEKSGIKQYITVCQQIRADILTIYLEHVDFIHRTFALFCPMRMSGCIAAIRISISIAICCFIAFSHYTVHYIDTGDLIIAMMMMWDQSQNMHGHTYSHQNPKYLFIDKS